MGTQKKKTNKQILNKKKKEMLCYAVERQSIIHTCDRNLDHLYILYLIFLHNRMCIIKEFSIVLLNKN